MRALFALAICVCVQIGIAANRSCAYGAPGDLIELRGTAVYECGGVLMESDVVCRLAVGSPVLDTPVYIPRPGPAAAGVTRVWYQRVGGGYVQLRGVQLSDGRVLTEFGDVVDLATSGGAY